MLALPDLGADRATQTPSASTDNLPSDLGEARVARGAWLLSSTPSIDCAYEVAGSVEVLHRQLAGGQRLEVAALPPFVFDFRAKAPRRTRPDSLRFQS
jgi:hypothetical protein